MLEGIKVLDFGRFIAGPYCAALLADYGAEVIRIDRVEGGEDRYIVPVTESGGRHVPATEPQQALLDAGSR